MIVLNALKEYKIFFKFWGLFLSIGAIFRVILSLLFLDNIDSDILYSILYGFRMDTIVFSVITIILVLLYSLNFIKTAKTILTLAVLAYLAIEISTITFMSTFFVRPNYLFIEHLDNPYEILLMVWKLYTFYLIIVIPLLAYVVYRLYRYFGKNLTRGSVKLRVIALPIMLVILLLGARSSIDVSTPNPAYYTFSNSDIHNEIANNSIFSILYAKYLMKKEKFYKYGDISEKEAISNIKIINNIQNNDESLLRYQESLFKEKKNIILVMLESFGHYHVGYLGGTPTTPNLDKLTKESLYFTNLYATGTRTSWGVSTITTSLYPIPTREYVKASKSQKDFYTIAKTLKNHGYENTFLYSGDANFDNMRGFLLSNGYDKIYGKEDFDSSKKRYTWGYCDEDLYEKAISLIEESKDKPFFITMLTLSSHEPFDYPQENIELYKDAKAEGFANSIKYADYAIGKFIDSLKEKGMMKDTVIAFVADHSNSASGSFDVPIDKYKIAALIVSDDFKGGKKYDKIASQIDFAPTILDVAGISDYIPTMGSSVLQNERDSAIVLANKKNFAYLLKDSFVLYKENSNTQTYSYSLKKMKSNPKNVKDGLSYIYSSKYLYEHKDLYNILPRVAAKELK